MGCLGCPDYDSCREICAKAEEFVNQDCVPQKHLIPQKPIVKTAPLPAPRNNEDLILDLFFCEGKTVTQTAEILGLSHQYVSRVTQKYKEILRLNLREKVASRS